MKLKLKDEQLDKIYIKMLKSQSKNIKSSIAYLEDLKNISEYQKEDLENDKKILDALNIIIQYNSIYMED